MANYSYLGRKTILGAGFWLSLIAFVCLLIAVASPYWVQSWPRLYNPFEKIGMWEACFQGLTFENPNAARKMSYHGCWWILSTVYNDIRSWMNPAWFVFAQVVTSICMAAEFLNLFFILAIYFSNRDTHSRKDVDLRPIKGMVAVTICCAVLKAVMVIEFGLMVHYDRDWMPHRDINYLSWSYGLAVVSTFFSIFASIANLMYSEIQRDERNREQKMGQRH